MEEKVWLTSDLHFGHKNVLLHCPKRIELCGAKDTNDIEAHDKWLIELWNNTVSKKDTIYILGDFSFHSAEETKKILGNLNGKKYLILGNHDKSSEHLNGYFEKITQIEVKTFKKTVFPFLKESFTVCMCHYPIADWPHKNYYSVMVHGHCHGNFDSINYQSSDLRIDIGLDGKFANYGFVSLEQLYNRMQDKMHEFHRIPLKLV